MHIPRFTGLVIMALLMSHLWASDTAKEKRWAEQITDTLMIGEEEWLTAGKQRFLALYAEPENGDTKGGAIIVHGIGVHPNWPEVIFPLRTQMIEEGWATLSIQMPVLPNEAGSSEYAPLFDDVGPRFHAAIDFLKSQGIENIVIVAHSLGAAMASYFLASERSPDIKAFVGIGMSAPSDDARMDNSASLSVIDIPVLDLYGSDDLKRVRDSAKQRSDAARFNSAYTQVEIVGADHFFDGRNEELVSTVVQWLDKNR